MKVQIFTTQSVMGKEKRKRRLRYEAEVANEEEALAAFHRYCLKLNKPWHLSERTTVREINAWRGAYVEAFPEIIP